MALIIDNTTQGKYQKLDKNWKAEITTLFKRHFDMSEDSFYLRMNGKRQCTPLEYNWIVAKIEEYHNLFVGVPVQNLSQPMVGVGKN